MSKDRDSDNLDAGSKPGKASGPRAKARELEKRALARSRARTPPPAPAAPPPAPPPAGADATPSLPQWLEPMRGLPNAALRSALFGAIRRGRRTFLQRQQMASVNGLKVLFTGPRLDQADLDVWEQCLHLARTGGLGCRIHFAARGFLKAIGRAGGGKDAEWLKNAFARLASSVVEIQDGRRAYFGPMLHRGARDDATGQYVIELNPEIRALYGPGGWSQIDWGVRRELSGQPLAQWLHGFYSTHAEPYPYKVETLYGLCGSENQELKGFRRELREALQCVLDAGGIHSWAIDADDLVHVDPVRTAAQERHLARRHGRKPKKPDGHDPDKPE